MSRYIDVATFDVFGYTRPTGKYDFDDGVEFVLNKIDETPTADVRENVHGEWIKQINPNYSPFDGTDGYIYTCNKCSTKYLYNYNYCPTCGVDMQEEVEE